MDRTPYLITFGTYGSRLHGDPRGSWQPRDQRYEGPLPRDDFRANFERRRMLHPPVTIDPAQRSIIERAIEEVCRHKDWLLLALNVRTEHVHAVVAADVPPEDVMRTFKAYSTRRLREARATDPSAPYWARHGSTRYLFRDGTVESAIDYVLNRQGEWLPGSKWFGSELPSGEQHPSAP